MCYVNRTYRVLLTLGNADENPHNHRILRPESKAPQMQPKVTCHAEANAATIRLSQTDVMGSEEVTPGVVFDFDAEGHIVGIELLDARGQLTADMLVEAA